jgi:DNA-3-methyladenine glycosylase I
VARLMADPGIVRNRLKIVSTIRNAEAFLAVQKEFGSFDAYLWRFVGGAPTDHRIDSLKNVPAKTAESDAMSKALLKRGFKFVGSTICYAFMQAVGMVNDHHVACFRHNEVAATLTQHARPAAHHTAGTKLRGKGRNTARGETRA